MTAFAPITETKARGTKPTYTAYYVTSAAEGRWLTRITTHENDGYRESGRSLTQSEGMRITELSSRWAASSIQAMLADEGGQRSCNSRCLRRIAVRTAIAGAADASRLTQRAVDELTRL